MQFRPMHKKPCKTISVGLKKFTSYLDRLSVEQELEKLFLEFLNHLRLPNPKLKWRFRAGDICTTCEKNAAAAGDGNTGRAIAWIVDQKSVVLK